MAHPVRFLAVLLFLGFSLSPVRGQNAADSFNPDVNGAVRAIAFAADGSCLIGGDFTSVGGVGRNRIARVLPDGTLDAAFNPNINGSVNAIVVLPDGRIVVGGSFTTVGGRLRQGLVRLFPVGAVDEFFTPSAVGGAVLALAVQPDSRILVGGQFASISGMPRRGLARVTEHGVPDGLFDAALNGEVRTLAVLRDGKIAAGGTFTAAGDSVANGLVRLQQNGQLDFAYPIPSGTAVRSLAAWPDGGIAASLLSGAQNQVVLFTGAPASPPAVNVSGPVHSVCLQSDGKVLAAGNFTTAGGQARNHLFRLTRSGVLDPLATAAGSEVLCAAIQPDGKIVVGGNFTTIGARSRNRLARLYSDGRMDTSFNPGSDAFDLGGNGAVALIAQQPDGLLLAGGYQHTLAGQVRIGLGRLYADGELDAPFNPAAGPVPGDPEVNCAIVQEDGKIIVGGDFGQIGGLVRAQLARIHPDGTADSTFSANITFEGTWSRVAALALQPDGKVVVGGRFNRIGGIARTNLARLNANGTVDASFNPAPSEMVETLAIQDDGKILVGGGFGTIGGATRASIARLNADGSVDSSFNPGADSAVYSLAVQPDGKILVGGYFDRLGGAAKYRLGRLNADGTLDTGFNAPPGGDFPRIYSIALQANGMFIVSGTFTSINGTIRNQIARLFPNGTLDTTWNPNAGSFGYVPSVGLMDDGKCIAGGNYSNIGGQSRRNIARLSNRYAALQELGLDAAGTTVVWKRGGAAPEVYQTTFDYSLDGVNFTRLGNASRVAGGWQLAGAALPSTGTFLLRARARGLGGFQNASTGLIESLRLVHRGAEITVESGGVSYVSLQVQPVDFGTVRTGNPVERTVNITNSGNAPLTITSYVHAQGFEVFDFPELPLQLAGGASLPVRVRMTAALPGPYTGSLLIQSNDADEEVFQLPLSGTVIAPEIALYEGDTVSPPGLVSGNSPPVDFGTTRQGTAVSRVMTVANHGSAPLLLQSLPAPAGFAWQDLPAFPVEIAPDATRAFTLVMTATAPGDFTGGVAVGNDDDDENPFRFSVTGRVITPEITVHAGNTIAAAELSDGQASAVNMGRIVQASPGIQPLLIFNLGTAPLKVEALTAPEGFALTAPPLPFLVEPGTGTLVTANLVALQPGVYSGSVRIQSDDLDEPLFTFPLTAEVFIPAPVPALSSSSAPLNRQTGLREQTLTLRNDTTATVPAYRILVRGLPEGLRVHNASAVHGDGTAEILILQTLQPFSQQQVILEFYAASRQPAEFTPGITVEVILDPPAMAPGAGQAFDIDRLLRLPSGDMLLEFASEPGQRYSVEYAGAAGVWQRSALVVRAAGNRVQWIDRGPPQTDSHPASVGSRFYRIRKLEE